MANNERCPTCHADKASPEPFGAYTYPCGCQSYIPHKRCQIHNQACLGITPCRDKWHSVSGEPARPTSSPSVAPKEKCVDCRDYEANIRGWSKQLGGDATKTHMSAELEWLIDKLVAPKEVAPAGVVEALREHCNVQGRLGCFLNEMVADLQIQNRGDYLRDLFGKFYWEACKLALSVPQEPDLNCPKCGEVLRGGTCVSPDCAYEAKLEAIGHGGDYRDFLSSQEPSTSVEEARDGEWIIPFERLVAIKNDPRVQAEGDPQEELVEAILLAAFANRGRE